MLLSVSPGRPRLGVRRWFKTDSRTLCYSSFESHTLEAEIYKLANRMWRGVRSSCSTLSAQTMSSQTMRLMWASVGVSPGSNMRALASRVPWGGSTSLTSVQPASRMSRIVRSQLLKNKNLTKLAECRYANWRVNRAEVHKQQKRFFRKSVGYHS